MINRRMLLGSVLFAHACAGSNVLAQDAPEPRDFSRLLAQFDAAGIVRSADIPYSTAAGASSDRNLLDVYSTKYPAAAPVIIFFHGGSWQRGQKSAVGQKPLGFVPMGYVVVSATYRFRPEVTVAEMATDVARAVAWVKGNISQYGGDPTRVFLMGHSAGAHLVSLVGTNGSYLNSVGLKLADLDGVISLDTGPYNVGKQLERVQGRSSVYAQMIRSVFEGDPKTLEAVSPLNNIARGKGIPPFMVVASDNRADVADQAAPFVAGLKAAGVKAELFIALGRTHGSLNTELGATGDPASQEILRFLKDNT
jgi:arylformamidase